MDGVVFVFEEIVDGDFEDGVELLEIEGGDIEKVGLSVKFGGGMSDVVEKQQGNISEVEEALMFVAVPAFELDQTPQRASRLRAGLVAQVQIVHHEQMVPISSMLEHTVTTHNQLALQFIHHSLHVR